MIENKCSDAPLKVLHICNGYAMNDLYYQLFAQLANLGIEQSVFVPLRYYSGSGNQAKKTDKFSVHGKVVVRSIFDRLFFRRKIRKITHYIEQQRLYSDISLSHAHTLFSDGAVALNLKRKYKIPYIVAVRNTDINCFLKYMPFLRNYGLEILQNAEKIIFISKVYQNHLKKYYPTWYESSTHKLEFIPNGINQFWLDNLGYKTHKVDNRFNLIFAGDFSKGKNLIATCEAVKKLHISGYNVGITAFGLGRPNENKQIVKVLTEFAQNHPFIKLHKAIPKEKLLLKYKDSDIFVMASHTETFGLVYAEALAQGLPIVYTKGQGIDGAFADGYVGKSVNSRSVDDIAQGIEFVINNYNELVNNIKTLNLSKFFDWSKIAPKYLLIYKNI